MKIQIFNRENIVSCGQDITKAYVNYSDDKSNKSGYSYAVGHDATDQELVAALWNNPVFPA